MKKYFTWLLGLAFFLAPGIGHAVEKWVGWGDLRPGPNAVGFKLTTAYDQSRVFHSNPAYRGLPEQAETARPIRIYMWYPAQAAGQESLRLGDYVRMAADDFGLIAEGKKPADDALPLPVQLAKGLKEDQRRRLFAGKTTAIPNASPQTQQFPLIILGQGLYYESPLTHFTLAEYLASQGYVVATCPLLGTYSRLTQLTAADLETEVRDMEFVISQTRLLPFVDKDRMGLVGYDLGGMAGLLLAMRNPWIKAMTTLSSGILYPHFSGLPGNSPHYREARFTIPWLMITSSGDVNSEKNLFDRKTAGDSYLLLFDTHNHGGYTSYAMLGIESEVPGFWGPIKGNPQRLLETICLYTARFFDGYLKKDLGALEFLSQDPKQAGTADVLVSAKKKTGEAAPLFPDDYIHEIITRGTAAARPKIRSGLAAGKNAVPFEESALSWLGLHFLYWWGREKEAVDVFQLMTELFPKSADAFASLGEASLAAGDKNQALASYRQALQLKPDSGRLQAIIKRLEEKK
jgi:tetratricopeptide (TPR) repeat protein